MPVYTVQAPNGKTYKIEGPPGATSEQLGAVISQHDPSAGQKRKTISDRAAPAKKQGWFGTMTENLVNAATAGYADNGLAALNALESRHKGENFSDAYRRNLAGIHSAGRADDQAHPIASIGGSVAGVVASPVNKIGAGIKGVNALARFGRFAAPAVAYGAAEAAHGAGNAMQRLERAGVGAVEGAASAAVLGGTLKGLGKVGSAVAKRIGETNAMKRIAGTLGVRPEALKRIAQRIEQDRVAGGPSAEDIRAEMAKDKGKPTALVDYAGENLKGFAGRIARSPGPARQIMKEALNSRDKGAGLRIAGDIRRSISSGNADATTQELLARRAVAAKPLYKEAYKQRPIQPDLMKPEGAIGSLLTRPSMKRGLGNAYRIAAEEGVDPHTLGLDLDAQGEPIFLKVPTWETLDYIKRGLDDVVESYRDKTTGKLVLDTYGRAADQTRTQFRTTLTTLNKPYGKALAAYSGPSQSIEATRAGERALSMRNPEELSRRFSAFSENDREFFKMGVASDLLKKITRTSHGGDESKRITGNDWVGMMIRPLFKDQASFDKFIRSIDTEARMYATRQHLVGGSDTARRVAEDGSEANQEIAKYAGHAVMNAAGHNPLGAVSNAMKALQTSRAARDPALNADIARILTLPPDKAAKAIRLLSRKPLPTRTRNALAAVMRHKAVEHVARSSAALGPVAAQQLFGGGS